jgi:Bacterial protein of unknown function (DUF899)
MKFGIGQPMRRHEDLRLITGRGRYTDDVILPQVTFVLRSASRKLDAHSCAEVKRKMRTIAPFSTCWCGEVPRFRRRFNVSPPAHVPNWKSTSSQDYLLLARRRRELPRVRIDKEYRFEIDEGSALLADLFRGRSHSSSSRRTSCRHASFAIRRRRCSRSSSLPRI